MRAAAPAPPPPGVFSLWTTLPWSVFLRSGFLTGHPGPARAGQPPSGREAVAGRSAPPARRPWPPPHTAAHSMHAGALLRRGTCRHAKHIGRSCHSVCVGAVSPGMQSSPCLHTQYELLTCQKYFRRIGDYLTAIPCPPRKNKGACAYDRGTLKLPF